MAGGSLEGMIARIGDRLLADGNRIGLIIAVPHDDGTPPYIVKWLSDGHIAMVAPDHHMRVERADERPAL
jgi:uncharacterized protein DUF1918